MGEEEKGKYTSTSFQDLKKAFHHEKVQKHKSFTLHLLQITIAKNSAINQTMTHIHLSICSKVVVTYVVNVAA